MGDMKTPDFDDLLAAFDIPDATGLDAKENIQESHEESNCHREHSGICLDESLLNNQAVAVADVPAVSVIVKNTSQHESLDSLIERSHSGSLENGFRGQCATAKLAEANSSFSKPFLPSLNGQSSGELLGKAPLHCKPEGAFSQPFLHFSPVSCSGAEKYDRSQEERDCFTEVLMEPLTVDNPKKVDVSIFEKFTKDSQKSANSCKSEIKTLREPCESETDKLPNFQSESNNKQDCADISCMSGTAAEIPFTYANSQTKLSSCLEALVALNAKRDPSEPPNLRESAAIQNDCVKVSPKVPISPRSPQSPRNTVKRLLKPSDSPVSVCSDSSGKGSPAVASASPAAIPRVRIKTIKTTSGHIKRTVTSVLPDSETDEVYSAYESSPCQSMISEDSYNMSPCPVNDSLQTKSATVVKSSPKLVLNKSKAISRRLGMSQSAVVVNNKRGPLKRPAVAQKPKKSSPTESSPNPNFVPKAMHLASLNLVPHSVAATVTARSTCHQHTAPTLSSTVYSSVPLVHQVKSAKPHTRDCVPNSAAGTLNRLLNHANPVPTYVPDLNPPPESNISLPPRGYCCLECGDSFGVERSLAYHYSRRSVHIEVTCTHCRKTLVFFNRCALLAHAREHKNSGTVMQCTQLYMKPIAEEQMFVPLSTAPLNMDSCSFMSSLHKNQPVMPLYPDNIIRQRLCCMECNKQIADLKELAGHYQRFSENTDGLMCEVCSMFLPNKCSLKAHQRIHAHKSPYCCPECGVLSRSADIQKHIKENCLHYARKAWYKCLHCDLVFKSLQGQKTHIDEKHCEMFFKCSICPVAFKTSDRCEVHLTNKHNASKLSPQLIFKCSCETIFKKRHLLYQHFNQDAYKRVTCVFKCPKCHTVFALKQQLMQHFKGVHVEKTQKQIVRTDQDKEEKKADSFGKHMVSPRKKANGGQPCAKPSGWTCGDCHQWFSERDAYVCHVKSSHGKPMKRYPCRNCEQSFNFNSSLRKHIRKDHDGKNKIYVCWYCTDTKTTCTTSVMLKNHISLMHGIKNPDLAQMPKTFGQESNNSLRKTLGSEKPVVSTKMDEEAEAEDMTAPASKRMKMMFRCSKCGYVTDDRMEFQQHIPQHKTDENTPQCSHCGLCFTSGLALNRHLYIVHKVKRPEDEAEDHQPFTKSRAEDKEVKDSAMELNKPEPSQSQGAL